SSTTSTSGCAGARSTVALSRGITVIPLAAGRPHDLDPVVDPLNALDTDDGLLGELLEVVGGETPTQGQHSPLVRAADALQGEVTVAVQPALGRLGGSRVAGGLGRRLREGLVGVGQGD